jgi:hypothetical protein
MGSLARGSRRASFKDGFAKALSNRTSKSVMHPSRTNISRFPTFHGFYSRPESARKFTLENPSAFRISLTNITVDIEKVVEAIDRD